MECWSSFKYRTALKINLPLFYSATIKNAVTTRVYLPDQKPMNDWQIFLQNITFTMNISASSLLLLNKNCLIFKVFKCLTFN